MGVYIDIEMPKECNYCACFSDEYWRCQVADYWERGNVYGERPDWCPLIEIPKHGRLIDADALPRFGGRRGLVHSKDIDEAPTIIPGEGK